MVSLFTLEVSSGIQQLTQSTQMNKHKQHMYTPRYCLHARLRTWKACLGILIKCLRHIDDFMRPMVSSWFAKEVSSGIREYQPHIYSCRVNEDDILYAFPGIAVQSPLPNSRGPFRSEPSLGRDNCLGGTDTDSRSIRCDSCRRWKGIGCMGEYSCSCLVADLDRSSIPFAIGFAIVVHGLSNLVLANVCQGTIDDPLYLDACMSIGSSRVAFEFRLIMHVVRFSTLARWFPSTSGHADILDVSHSQTTLYSYRLVSCAWSPILPRH